MGLKRKPQKPEDAVRQRIDGVAQKVDIVNVKVSGEEKQIVVPPSYAMKVPEIFEWTAEKIRVAELISEGVPISKIVSLPGMPTSRTTIYSWTKHPEFDKYIKTLVMEMGLANQTERVAAMNNLLNKLYKKLTDELVNVNITDKNAASLIEKFFNGLRQVQEDIKGYVNEIKITADQNIKQQGMNVTIDLDKVLEKCPEEKRALLQEEFSRRADEFIRIMDAAQAPPETPVSGNT